MNNFALTINSHSSNIVCLDLFFKQLNKFVDKNIFNNIYLFIDKLNNYIAPNDIKTIFYDSRQSFTEQMRFCLRNVTEKYLLYANEDYLFYDKVDVNKLEKFIEILDETYFHYIKLVHSDLERYPELAKNLFYISAASKNNYSQTLTIWKTEILCDIYNRILKAGIGKDGDIIGHAEELAKTVCKYLGIHGLCYYNGEPKRGICHYDSSIIPHIASALTRGKWNTKEYPELTEILIENGIKA